jgi:DNA-binding transcriptional ArsR family regulator
MKMNDKSIWSIFKANDPVSTNLPDNELITNIISILSFIRDHRDLVGITMYSMTVDFIAAGVDLPESTVYRYVRKLTKTGLIQQDIKCVRVFQSIEPERPIAGELPARFFKDGDGNDVMPGDVGNPRIYMQNGETTIKMYKLTDTGENFLTRARSE